MVLCRSLDFLRTRRTLLVSTLACLSLVLSNLSTSFKGSFSFRSGNFDQLQTKSKLALKSERVKNTTVQLPSNENAVPFNVSSKEWSIPFEIPIKLSSTASSANLSSSSTKERAPSTDDTQSPTNDDGSQKPPKPLNVLIIYPDDWRHDTLGCAGTQPVKTPFLDFLASKGIRFTHNCVTTSVCWISRATLFTG